MKTKLTESNIQMLLQEFEVRLGVVEKLNMKKLAKSDFIWIYHYEEELTREYIKLRKTYRDKANLKNFILGEYEYLLRNE